MPFNIWAREPRVKNGLRGEALVTRSAAAPEPASSEVDTGMTGGWNRFAARAQLIVRVPGRPPFSDEQMRPLTRARYPVIGMHLPVEVSEDLRKVAILWGEAPTVDEFVAGGAHTFTDPDALVAELVGAWEEVVAHHGGAIPARRTHPPVDGPNARVRAVGRSTSAYNVRHGGKWELLLSVAEPGKPRYGCRWQGKVPRGTLILAGQDLPVEVTRRGVEILWDRVGPPAELGPFGELTKPMGLRAGLRMQRALVKDAADALRSATATDREALAQRARLSQIMANGIELPATIDAFTVGDPEPAMNALTTELSLTVEPPGRAGYAVRFTQPLPETVTRALAAGQRVTVRVAPADPQAVMLWNTPHAAGGADPDTGRPLDSGRGE